MGFWQKFIQRLTGGNKPISTGRKTDLGVNRLGRLSSFRSRTTDVLEELRIIRTESEAIDFLQKCNPDVSMAVWNFVRLANQGHEMKFYDSKDGGNMLSEVEERWRDFSARVNHISNAGLDGMIDIMHKMAFMRGAQALEVEVNRQRTDIVDVHPIIPQTIEWEVEDRNGRKVWIPYQQQMWQRVSLEPGKANFFWVPTDPDPDDPRGNLVLTPVLQAVDFQLQILQDLQAVLHHQGWPRNDIKIMLERVLTRMPQDVKAGKRKIEDWLTEVWDEIVEKMNKLDPDSDYIHFDDIEINMNQGANASRSLDVRAIAELVDIQTLSGSKQMSIFMNRNQGITESWGSIQFLIFCSGIASIQRGSKRLVEEIARLWLRVSGIQAVPVFTHNKVDWQSEEQRLSVRLMEEQFWAIAQLMGWVDRDKAAQEVTGVEKAYGDPVDDRVRVTFSRGGGDREDIDRRKSGQEPDNVAYLRREMDRERWGT